MPTLSKALENVIHKRVYSFLNGNSRLYRYIYGFRERHYTMDAVAQLLIVLCWLMMIIMSTPLQLA